MSVVEFCTCNDLNCPFNPKTHKNGCTGCIAKNLKNNEIPDCFFKRIGTETNIKSDYTFFKFAEKVLNSTNTMN